MALYFLPLLVENKPVIFGMAEGRITNKDRHLLASSIAAAGNRPVRVILFSAKKDSQDTSFWLSSGREIEILGQQGETFQYALTRSPTLRKILRFKNLYTGTLSRVKMLLAKDYKLSPDEIEKAIDAYQLESFFIADADMAAHDSNEDWAKRIYEFWSGT